jgi:hypothetical protein|tara:strand:- start:242 stop:577 length:336 start_codon:yes stop_codon:yes gene_type:complete
MAYFARLDENNKVIRISSINDAEVSTEQAGIDFLTQHNNGGWYKQTYVDGSQRKNYAGVGYAYDASRDAFIEPQRFPSWTLNETTCRWEAPVAYPDDGEKYSWNESSKQWE